MAGDPDVEQVAAALYLSVGLLRRQLRRQRRLVQAFLLYAQRQHDIRVFQCFVDARDAAVAVFAEVKPALGIDEQAVGARFVAGVAAARQSVRAWRAAACAACCSGVIAVVPPAVPVPLTAADAP